MKHLFRFLAPVVFGLLFLALPSSAYAAGYTVQSGDTLSTIAPRYGVSWQSLCSHNRLPDCNRISVGQLLDIPSGSAPSTAAPAGVPGLDQALRAPYVYGGTSLAGFDCSGLTQWLAARRGISIPRTTYQQIAALRHIPLDQAQPGDVVAFNANHVGTYIGGGNVIQALNPTQGILITTVQSGIAYNGYLATLAVGH